MHRSAGQFNRGSVGHRKHYPASIDWSKARQWRTNVLTSAWRLRQ
jgi:hypothetical protein